MVDALKHPAARHIHCLVFRYSQRPPVRQGMRRATSVKHLSSSPPFNIELLQGAIDAAATIAVLTLCQQQKGNQ